MNTFKTDDWETLDEEWINPPPSGEDLKEEWINPPLQERRITTYQTRIAETSFPGSGRGNIFAYLRRSVEDRRESNPLQLQRNVIEEYVTDKLAMTEGIHTWFVDNGISGSTPLKQRPGVQKMLEIFGETKTTYRHAHLVVYDHSRIARSQTAGYAFRELLENRAITLHIARSGMQVDSRQPEHLFFMQMQIATQERLNASFRTKNKLNSIDWDPRKSFGWNYDGRGTTPEKNEKEQIILEQMRVMYEEEGRSVAHITQTIQAQTGGHRSRKIGLAREEWTNWSSSEVATIARINKWKWKGKTREDDLMQETTMAREKGDSLETFFQAHQGQLFDGLRLTRLILHPYFPNDMPPEKRAIWDKIHYWINQGCFTMDDMMCMLNETHPRIVSGRIKISSWSHETLGKWIRDVRIMMRALKEDER